jgi:hypothetical protein
VENKEESTPKITKPIKKQRRGSSLKRKLQKAAGEQSESNKRAKLNNPVSEQAVPSKTVNVKLQNKAATKHAQAKSKKVKTKSE